MATKKITELNELETASDNDLLVIVDVANNETKKIKAVNIGTGGSVDIPQQDTAPEDPTEDDLWIDTDDNTNLVGVVSSTTVSEKDTYSCNYLNQHLYDMYSENEVLTNKIWIDGRPVYRKVVEKTSGITTGGASISFDFTNLNLVKYEAFYINTNNQMETPYYNNGDDKFRCLVQQNSNQIYYILGSGLTNISTIRVILEYTKTTDSGDR